MDLEAAMEKRIKISHEVPLELLNSSRIFNDYDYALVHLFEVYPEYLQFFKDSIKQGREVLLDNSIFELKEAFEPNAYAKWVQELNPTRYILPDVLDDCDATIANMIEWNKTFPHIAGSKIGVVQGKSYEELTKCYKEILKHCDEVAICFPHSHHQSLGLTKVAFEQRMLNRGKLLERWVEEGVIDKSRRHHLLGCLLPQEFKAYKKYSFIYSLDTSNPIVHGLVGVIYNEGCLDDKVDIKMADIMEIKISDEQFDDIYYNIRSFKNNLI